MTESATEPVLSLAARPNRGTSPHMATAAEIARKALERIAHRHWLPEEAKTSSQTMCHCLNRLPHSIQFHPLVHHPLAWQKRLIPSLQPQPRHLKPAGVGQNIHQWKLIGAPEVGLTPRVSKDNEHTLFWEVHHLNYRRVMSWKTEAVWFLK